MCMIALRCVAYDQRKQCSKSCVPQHRFGVILFKQLLHPYPSRSEPTNSITPESRAFVVGDENLQGGYRPDLARVPPAERATFQALTDVLYDSKGLWRSWAVWPSFQNAVQSPALVKWKSSWAQLWALSRQALCSKRGESYSSLRIGCWS